MEFTPRASGENPNGTIDRFYNRQLAAGRTRILVQGKSQRTDKGMGLDYFLRSFMAEVATQILLATAARAVVAVVERRHCPRALPNPPPCWPSNFWNSITESASR
jgi:hypothetical protein